MKEKFDVFIDKSIKDIEAKSKELAKALGEIAIHEAQVQNDMVLENFYNGEDTEIIYEIEETDKGVVVRERGRIVCFIEFGAGVYYNGSGIYEGEIPEGIVGIGEYGYGLGKNLVWKYTNSKGEKVTTAGNPASNGMYRGYVEIKDKVKDKAKEIFK